MVAPHPVSEVRLGSPNTLERLVQAAVDLYQRPGDIPPAVMERAAVQHLSAAGVVRSVVRAHALDVPASDAGQTSRVGGESSDPASAVAWHTGVAGWLELDDHLLRGRSCAATAAAAWAAASPDHNRAQILAATVVGNELSGRIGLATLLGAPEWGCAPGTAASVALVTGLLRGQDAPTLARSVAAALGDTGQPVSDRPSLQPLDGPDARAARRGVEAVGAAGDPARFDAQLEQWSWRPLRGALEGMGTTWLTDTITTRIHASAPSGQTAVEAVHEILKRHVKAADKRLRVDQVERIVIRVPAAAAGLGVRGALEPASVPWSVPNLLGVLVAQHALGAADLAPDVLARRSEAIAHVADRVEWVVDRGLSARSLSSQLAVLGPLAGDFDWKDARKVLSRTLAGKRKAGRPDRKRLKVWAELVQRMWAQRGRSGDLAAIDMSSWQLHIPVEVELYTTRGGRWPERRSLPEGGPGASWDGQLAAVVERFDTAAGEGTTGREWLQGALDQPAVSAVQELLGITH